MASDWLVFLPGVSDWLACLLEVGEVVLAEFWRWLFEVDVGGRFGGSLGLPFLLL